MVFVSFTVSGCMARILPLKGSLYTMSSLLPRLAEVRLITGGSPTYTSPLPLPVYSWLPGTVGGKVLQHNSCIDIAYFYRSELG